VNTHSSGRAGARLLRPAFGIDPKKCTECERCMAACALAKTGAVRLAEARIRIERRWPEVPGIHVCRLEDCEGQPCIAACPVEAIANRDGYVLIDREACTGCGACVEACPYQAIRLDEEERAFKCDFCGGQPACVPECVTGALAVAAPAAGAGSGGSGATGGGAVGLEKGGRS
jgi:carbon-monoxide dehydrogenase iron sulfur subunit